MIFREVAESQMFLCCIEVSGAKSIFSLPKHFVPSTFYPSMELLCLLNVSVINSEIY